MGQLGDMASVDEKGYTPQKGQRLKAIVIGAGAGGIGVAARLAKAGMDVTVVEKNDFTGGRCSIFRTERGFRFDQGPSLLLLPDLFRETFSDLGVGRLEDAGVELLRCQTNYNIWFSDGECFHASTDTACMRDEVERFEGPDGWGRYLTWLNEARAHYVLSVEHVLRRNFTSYLDLLRPRFLWAALSMHPLETSWRRASRYFWTERLRRVFTFATMYMGMSPFDAPATYSLLQYTELAEGIWYPRGGFHAVLDALVRLAEQAGVDFRLRTPVAAITTADDDDANDATTTANGVRLADGTTLSADVVVVNADLVYAYSELFPQTPAISRYAASLRARPASCSSISFYWSLSRRVPELGTHNIFIADAYRDSFDAIFKHHRLPADPSFYVNVPSRVDASAAPPGCDAVVVLVPVGHMDAAAEPCQDWAALVAEARRAVLATVRARTGCADLAALVVEERVNTPETWKAAFNLDRGSILGLSHDFFSVLAFRPRTRAVGLARTYCVGASAHPGTGVPIVLAGAKLTAEQVLRDVGLPVPWRHAGVAAVAAANAKAKRSSLDRITRSLWQKDSSLMMAVLVAVLMSVIVFLWSSQGTRGTRGTPGTQGIRLKMEV